MHRFAVFVFLVGCVGAQKTKAQKDAELCPSTPAAVRDACGCRPSEADFIARVDNERWGGPADAQQMSGFARECATGTAGAAIGTCVKGKGTPGNIGKDVTIGLFTPSEATAAGWDASWLACSSKL